MAFIFHKHFPLICNINIIDVEGVLGQEEENSASIEDREMKKSVDVFSI